MRTSLLDWAVAGVPLHFGTESGDLHVVAWFGGGVLVGLIDGLGHGPEAAVAARAAASALTASADAAPEALLEECHEGMKHTRGAAMTLASIRAETAELRWLGVGNVEGILLRATPYQPTERAPLRGGIVGHRLPPLGPATVHVFPGDVLLLATDGIDSRFAGGLDRTASAAKLAESILAHHRKPTDDATVLAARYVGGGA